MLKKEPGLKPLPFFRRPLGRWFARGYLRPETTKAFHISPKKLQQMQEIVDMLWELQHLPEDDPEDDQDGGAEIRMWLWLTTQQYLGRPLHYAFQSGSLQLSVDQTIWYEIKYQVADLHF